ncbi:9107_t:CDS:2, partial [Paraglomus brasilianum]
HKASRKELYHFKKPKAQLNQDFQEFLITRLLLLCNKAEFLHTPLEQEQVPKEAEQCSQSIYHHFQTPMLWNMIWKKAKTSTPTPSPTTKNTKPLLN